MNRRLSLFRFAAFITPLVLALGSAAVLAPFPSQAATVAGSGKLVTEVRALPEFQAITLHAPVEVVVRQGPAQSVTLSGDDNLLPLLETVVEGGSVPTLALRFKRDSSIRFSSGWTMTRGGSPLRVTVVLPRVTALAVAGSGDLKLERFNTPALKVAVSGSGDIVLDTLASDDLQVSLAGSGDVRGSGQAKRLNVQLAGSGDVRLADLRADTVAVSLAGSGDVAVQAQGTLNVSLVGSGDVTYTGAATITRSIAGSGTVKQR